MSRKAKFTPEEKEQAVIDYLEGNKSRTQICGELCISSRTKLATTSSTGGLSLALQRAIVTARPKGRYRKHFYWPAIKRYYWNLLFSIPLLAHLYISELLHLLYCRLFQHNIL